jgi:hypothetical protein
MWARVESDTVTKIYTRPKALSIGDVNYPANIFSIWTKAELEAKGIYEVVVDNTNLKSGEYYINTDQNFAFASGTVTASYGTATARAIADVTTDGVVNRGLKYNHKEIIDQQAASLLQDTDWMVIRAAEGGTAVPGATTTWRAAVRTKANSMQAQIDGAANVDALAALYIYNSETPPVRPLGEFPILGE